MKEKKDKKAVSPLIATVLLIVVAIALFVIIFLWLRGFQKEALTKQGTPIELMCTEINFDVVLSVNSLQITNLGDVPIQKAKIYKIYSGSTSFFKDEGPIMQAESLTTNLEPLNCQSIKIIPVLLGTTTSGNQEEHICENQAKTISC